MAAEREDNDAEAGDEDALLAEIPAEAGDEGEAEPRPRALGRRSRSADEAQAGEDEGEQPARGGLTPLRDPVERFLSEARRYKRLSDKEERALGTAVRERGDMNAARTLVVHNLRLVISIAYQYRRAWANILDLFQEGSVGLMEAVKRWEPKLGPRFGTYAAYWIRAYVLRFLMTNSRLIHVGNTRAGRKLFFRLEKERQKLLAAGIDVTPKLLAAKLDVDEKDLDEVRRHLESREVSFDPMVKESAGGEEAYPLSERIAGAGESPEAEAAKAEMTTSLQHFVASFRDRLTDERERAVWMEHLASDEPTSLGELGARFGVSKQRMGQIADQLKRRFRSEIVEALGPEVRTDWLGAGQD
jgi:RNA polymerase sigma-32 factor